MRLSFSPGLQSRPQSTPQRPPSSTPRFGGQSPLSLIGFAEVTDRKTGQTVPVRIEESGRHSMDRTRYLLINGKRAGRIETTPDTFKKCLYVGDLGVNEFWMNRHYKGIGTALMQTAVEESLNEGYDGRTELYSLGTAATFYHRLGFRTNPQQWDGKRTPEQWDAAIRQEIADAAREKRPSDIGDCISMILPGIARIRWINAIMQRPILFETVNRLKTRAHDREAILPKVS